MKKLIIASLSVISSFGLMFLFSYSPTFASTTSWVPVATTYTETSQNVPLTSCPTGEQIVFNIGGPLCMFVYAPGANLPAGCTPNEANDILSDACQPELHWSFQLPNQPLTPDQAALLSQQTGQTVTPANQGWILCTEKDSYGCTGPGQWVWNSPDPVPPGGPPNTLDPYQDCAAATAIQEGSTTVYMLVGNGDGSGSSVPTVADQTVIHNSFFQGTLNNACSDAPYTPGPLVNNYAGTTGNPGTSNYAEASCRTPSDSNSGNISLPLCSATNTNSSSSSIFQISSPYINPNASNPLVITSSVDAQVKINNALFTNTKTIVQGALQAYLQMTGLPRSSSTLTSGSGTTSSNSACYQFTQTLQLGSIDPEVALLRQALIADGDLSSQASAGGEVALDDFDSTVQTAVITFQNKYASSILAPLGLVNGTGIVAVNTRTELNNLCLVPAQTTTTPAPTLPVPTISGVQGFNKTTNVYTPGTQVLAGTYLVLYGSFLSSGNGVKIDGQFSNAVTYESPTQINISVVGLTLGVHTIDVAEGGKDSINTFTIISAPVNTPAGPAITLSPSSGASGSGVTIIGNFPLLNQVSFGTVEQNADYYSTNNGTQIYFIVPYLNNNGFFNATSLPNGQYPVTVVNANGTSTATFTLTGGPVDSAGTAGPAVCAEANIPPGDTCSCANGQLAMCVNVNGITVPTPTTSN